MLFEQVIGQSKVKKRLTANARSGRVPHAQMFIGPKGSGQLAMALAYASYLQCENPGKTDACGSCSACTKSTKYIHPDIHFSYPSVGTNVISTELLKPWREALSENPYLDINNWLDRLGAENKQGNINKDECQDIMRKLGLRIFEGKYKVLVMWLPEYLAKEGNRLLKLIEEPPDNTVFLFAADDTDQILNTILSRCQLVKLDPLSDEDISQSLQQIDGVSRDQSLFAAYLCEGNYNRALQLVSETDTTITNILVNWLRVCNTGRGKEMVLWAERLAGASAFEGKKFGRKDQTHFIHYALHFLREITVLCFDKHRDARLLDQEKETAQKLAAYLNFDQIRMIVMLLDEVAYFIERNANPKILFLDTSIRIHKIMRQR